MKEIYQILADGREQDSQRFWTIFSLMSVINGGLFALIAGKDLPTSLSFVGPPLGIGICLIWYLVQRRMHGWVVWWEIKLCEFEPYVLQEANAERKSKALSPLPDTINIFLGRKGAVRQGISTRTAGWLLPLVFLLAWLVLFVITLIPLFPITR